MLERQPCKKRVWRWGNLHLGLNHSINETKLSLGNLDNLLDQSSTDLVLQFLDPIPC